MLAALPAIAQRSLLVPFQGVLTNQAGVPVPNGSITLHFALYQQMEGGSSVWTESQTVEIANGLFNAYLGSQTPIPPTLFADQLWLGIAVESDPEMVPRSLLGVVPYAAALYDTTEVGGIGEVCAEGSNCSSGYCVDGVCCEVECGGLCETCNGSVAGTCEPFAELTDPENSCGGYYCDGNGDCLGSCREEGDDCKPGFYCANVFLGFGECEPKKSDGFACATPDECASANCVDGYCCNSSCGSACETCDRAGFLGQCTASLPGFDPLCPPSTAFCDGGGGCVECLQNTDCPSGQLCLEFVCQDPF